jgi:hypothetical protein
LAKIILEESDQVDAVEVWSMAEGFAFFKEVAEHSWPGHEFAIF